MYRSYSVSILSSYESCLSQCELLPAFKCRRSKSILELVRPAQQQQQLSTVVAAIGPSSPESRWSTLHMSYSLTYHLVESEFLRFCFPKISELIARSIASSLAALHYTSEGTRYDGFDFPSFLSRFRAAQGRLDQFDPIDDVSPLLRTPLSAFC